MGERGRRYTDLINDLLGAQVKENAWRRKMTTLRISLLLILFTTFSMTVFAEGLVGSDIEYDRRVEKKLKKLDFNYKITKKGDFKLMFNVEDGRTQLVFINSNTEEYRDFEIREIWSIAYKSSDEQFPAKVANKLLEDTSRRKLGA